MKIKFYGTAAAEGVPALFCNCRVCLHAQKVKGKEIRSRTQSLIDDVLLIDFPGDTFLHKVRDDLPLSNIEHLLITHSHHDHFFGEDLMMRMSGYGAELDNCLTVYGNSTVHKMYKRAQELEGFKDEERLQYQEIKAYENFMILDYKITPLLADHALNEDCYIYQIKKGDRCMLYGHDTGYFLDSVWSYWEENQPFFQLVNLDCTHQKVKVDRNHMSLHDNLKIKEKMLALGYADDNTVFVLNHFSHNGLMTHKEMEAWGKEHDFIIAYDGLEIEF